MNPYRLQIYFRVFHPSISSEEIGRHVNLPIRRQWSVGEPKTTPTGRPTSGINDKTYCLFDLSPSEGQSLPELIETYTGILEQSKEFLAELSSTGGILEYYLTCFVTNNCGEVFNWKILEMLSKLHISLAFDVYPEAPGSLA